MIPSPEELEDLGTELRELFPGGVVPLGWALEFARERRMEVRWVTAARKAVGLELSIPERPRQSRPQRQRRVLELSPHREVPLKDRRVVAPKPSTFTRIERLLDERSTSGVAPAGTYSDIAREIGVTPQWVSSVARTLGWKTGPRPVRRPPCHQCVCGRVQRSSRLCPECAVVELPCEGCGVPVRRSATTLAKLVAYGPHSVGNGRMAGYTGRVFCGRPCFGRWMGSLRLERGMTDENLRALLNDRYPQRELPWGGWGKLSEELGMSRRSLKSAVETLGWRQARPVTGAAALGTEYLRELLEVRYPTRVVPWGEWGALARELRMDRKVVGLAARTVGWRAAPNAIGTRRRTVVDTYATHISSLRGGQVGRLQPAEGERLLLVKRRLRKAGERIGKRLDVWAAEGAVYFKCL